MLDGGVSARLIDSTNTPCPAGQAFRKCPVSRPSQLQSFMKEAALVRDLPPAARFTPAEGWSMQRAALRAAWRPTRLDLWMVRAFSATAPRSRSDGRLARDSKQRLEMTGAWSSNSWHRLRSIDFGHITDVLVGVAPITPIAIQTDIVRAGVNYGLSGPIVRMLTRKIVVGKTRRFLTQPRGWTPQVLSAHHSTYWSGFVHAMRDFCWIVTVFWTIAEIN